MIRLPRIRRVCGVLTTSIVLAGCSHTESLTVTTAAVNSGVEEDIFFLGFFSSVAVGFV